MLIAGTIQFIGRKYRVKVDKNAVILLEIFFYSIFLTTATIYSIGLTDSSMYYFNDVLKRTFVERPFILNEDGPEIDFTQIVHIEDWWQYVENVFLDGINGSLPMTTGNLCEEELVFHKNVLLGPPRIRQLRVKPNSCSIRDHFKRYFPSCYSAYSRSLEDFGSDGKRNYKPGGETYGIYYWGELALYNGGGYVENLGANRDENLKIIQNLKEENWFDAGTRLVIVEFALFNANADLFATMKLVVEAPPTGGLLPRSHIESLRLHADIPAVGLVYLINKAFYFLQIILFTIEEITEMRKNGAKYFKSFFNWIDLTIIIISYGAVAFLIYRHYYTRKLLENFKKYPDKHLSLDLIVFVQFHYTNMIAICIFLIWIKIFKYISFNKTMREFSITLRRCAKELLSFGVMFGIVFIAFAQLGYFLFGSEIYEYRYLSESVFTLMRTILGDFDYSNIEKANRILGPIYFLAYIFIVFFILLNMFLAIINDTYAQVKEEVEESDDVNLGKYLRKILCKLCGFVSCGMRTCALSKSMHKDAKDRKNLRNRQYRGKELQIAASSNMVFKRDNLLGTIYEEVESNEEFCEDTCPIPLAPQPGTGDGSRRCLESLECLSERVVNLEITVDYMVQQMSLLIQRLEATRK